MKNRNYTGKGKPVEDLSRRELIKALSSSIQNLFDMYRSRRKLIKLRKIKINKEQCEIIKRHFSEKHRGLNSLKECPSVRWFCDPVIQADLDVGGFINLPDA